MNRLTLPSILVTIGLALPAAAQTGGGHALDANQQVGSGGVNPAAPTVDYQLRNDLVTGNVAGGTGFRGDVGYTAPGAFRGATGSDSVFDFNARSLPPTTTGYSNYNYSGGGAGTSVYKEYTVPTLTPLSSSGGAPAYYSGGYQYVAPTPVGERPGFFRTALEGSPVNSLGAPTPVRGIDSQSQFTESSILGVRQYAPNLEPVVRPNADAAQPRNNDTLINDETAANPPTDDALNRASRRDTLVPRLPATGFEVLQATKPDDAATPEGAADNAVTQNPTLTLGRRLGAPHAGDRMDAQYARQLEQSIFATNTGVTAGQSIYNDLIKDVAAGKADTTDVTAWSSAYDLPEPDEDAVRQAEQDALEAVRKAYGLHEEDAEKKPGAEEPQAAETEKAPELQELIDKLNYDLPSIKTMAGQEQTRANEMIRQAEAAMGAGDFFKAESLYKQASLYTPDDPIVRVGIAHAQLGAGLFRSTSLTLRRLFEQHPELIAARYDARLLPSEERLRWVQSELSKLADNAESEPGFVTAYLGYQIGSRQLVRYGLALAQSNNPRDPMLPVLREIWLDAKPESAAPAPDAATGK